ncbi:MAG TPA: altronate dehydratase family protein [Terriglobales bacterium]|nr:altronate dehydratase family protein [Terriglobales bacterium]
MPGIAARARVLQLEPRDNVLVALTDLPAGEAIEFAGAACRLLRSVPAKHKFALRDFASGDEVVMYGVVVGKALQPIRRGELLTTRNLQHAAADFHPQEQAYRWNAPDVSRWRNRTFLGYRRADGQVGTRNYWLVVPLVFCENRNVGVLKSAFEDALGYALPQLYRDQVAELARLYQERRFDEISRSGPRPGATGSAQPRVFENLDGIKFLLHEGGCGGTHEDSRNLCGLIAGYLHHPNVAGATILSLGCQHAQLDILREELRRRDANFSKPLVELDQQQSGTETAIMSQAIKETFLGLIEANKCTRVPVPLAELCLGLKCGGSDGFSGISANPAIGHTSDLLAALGGRSILSEFPELCGVEQDLINRSANQEVGARFMTLMRDYAARARAVRSTFEMNPSPGNIRDGLLTDAMKSAGAEKKGGTSPVTAALDYPEYSTTAGLNLLCTPGSDVECVTAQVGAGANIVLFTTGLGTPTGNPIAPVAKISSNSQLAAKMADIIDLDAGTIITGEKTIPEVGAEILELVIAVASGGKKVKAEDLSQDDFIPWKRGVSL